MRSAVFFVAGLVFCVHVNPSAADPVAQQLTTINGYYEYRGELIVTGFTTATENTCKSDGQSIGNLYTVRFTPPNLGKNGNMWRLSVFTLSYGQNFQFASGNYPNTTGKTANAAYQIGRGASAFSVMPVIKIAKQVPATHSVDNPYVYFEGTIRNFSSIATTSLSEGCDITFRLSGNLKP